jgi:hypothetical protein
MAKRDDARQPAKKAALYKVPLPSCSWVISDPKNIMMAARNIQIVVIVNS